MNHKIFKISEQKQKIKAKIIVKVNQMKTQTNKNK